MHRLLGGVAGLGLGGLPFLLVLMLTASPALAAECIPTATAFSPGTWVASGITLRANDDDGHSVVQDRGQGGFRLTISESGDASGSISLAGHGVVASYLEGDDSGLSVDWTVSGSLSGNGTVIDIDGTQDLTFSGAIDSNPNGDGDPWSRTELWGFGNQTSRDYHRSFSPSAANCNQVLGSLGGPVEFGTQASGESYFLAVRVGAAPDVDLESQLIDLMARAEIVINGDPLDVDALTALVQDFVAFDSLLASLDDCAVASREPGPAWQMLRSVLLGVSHTFLATATTGLYTPREVIHVMTLVLQGGILGLRGADCLEPNDPEGISEVMERFDAVLLERLKGADGAVPGAERSTGDIAEIVAAAYQFQLPATIQYIEEFM